MIIPFQDTLRNDEIDDVLANITGEDFRHLDTREDEDGIKSYNIANQERIVRGRMPTLEVINERFARELRTGFYRYIRRSPEVSAQTVKVLKYNEFIRNLVVPTHLSLFSMKPLHGTGLLVVEPSLIFGIVDLMFGGAGRSQARGDQRGYSHTENKVISGLLDVIFEEYTNAWRPVYKHLDLKYLRSEVNTQFVNIANPSEIVVCTDFNIELGGGCASGMVHICFPYSSIEPIRDLLNSTMQGNQTETDVRWVKTLKNEMQKVAVDLVATLAESKHTVGQILELRAGDFIELDVPEKVVLSVDGIPLFEGQHGQNKSHYAVKIDKVLMKESFKTDSELLSEAEDHLLSTIMGPKTKKIGLEKEEESLLARALEMEMKHGESR